MGAVLARAAAAVPPCEGLLIAYAVGGVCAVACMAWHDCTAAAGCSISWTDTTDALGSTESEDFCIGGQCMAGTVFVRRECM